MPKQRNTEDGRVVDRIAAECHAVRARLVSRAVSSIYDEALRPLGLKVSQMNVLVVVRKRGPIQPGKVAGVLCMEKSTLSRNVERMRERGWLEITEGDDARRHQLRITAAGRRLLRRALPRWQGAQDETEALLGAAGCRALRNVAGRVWADRERS